MSTNSFDKFRQLIGGGRKEPSKSNLYTVDMSLPFVLRKKVDTIRTDYREAVESLSYLADQVVVPGKAIMTGTQSDVGVARNFAYSVNQYGPLSIDFLVTKDQIHNTIFQNWMSYTAHDGENRATFYDEYVTSINILKWETGSNVVYEGLTKEGKVARSRLNRVSAVWQFYGAFPKDISGMTWNNEQTQLQKLTVQFAYERFRFDTVDDGKWGGDTDSYINEFTDLGSALSTDTSQKQVAKVGY